MMRRALLAALAASLTLAGCSGTPAPTVTVTATHTSAWEAEQAAPPTPEPTPEPSQDIAALALQITWDDLTADQRESICFGYTTDPGMMLDAFTEGTGTDSQITRGDAATFLNDQC